MELPAWRVAGSSVTGSAHASAGRKCQDRHRVEVTRKGLLIAVVSDGAGSAAFGGEGAALLCDHVAGALAALAEHETRIGRAGLLAACRAVCQGVASARSVASTLAAECGSGIEAFHATLVGAVMLPGAGGLFFHIGDGAALALGKGGWTLSGPRNGEYADTTWFFTDPAWRKRLRFTRIGADAETVFVMSDGVTELGLKHNGGGTEPFMPFFEPIGRFLAQASREEGEQALTATLDSEAVRARTGDDKTLIWAQAR